MKKIFSLSVRSPAQLSENRTVSHKTNRSACTANIKQQNVKSRVSTVLQVSACLLMIIYLHMAMLFQPHIKNALQNNWPGLLKLYIYTSKPFINL